MDAVSSEVRDNRNVRQMIRDELTCNKIESWGEWNFLAKGMPVEKEGYEQDLVYDLVAVDLENRRIQADIIGYDSRINELMRESVGNLENDYGYLTPNVSGRMAYERGFHPPELEGSVFWEDDEAWMLRTSEFESVSNEIFGYDVLSRDYERIQADDC